MTLECVCFEITLLFGAAEQIPRLRARTFGDRDFFVRYGSGRHFVGLGIQQLAISIQRPAFREKLPKGGRDGRSPMHPGRTP
jgi:hypothetical protein